MAIRRNYVLHINGVDYHVVGARLPTGQHTADITLRLTKKAPKPLGPNYDGTANSILAAKLYAKMRPISRWGVWLHLYGARGRWVPGRLLSDTYGGEATRRVRELCVLGWPIEKRPHGRGMWDYRMPLPRPRLIKIGTP